jgi:hypothetical protein
MGEKKMNEEKNRKVVNRYHIKAAHTKTDKYGQT